ncbi:hypothetical protein CK203_095932 [Vitis vinifera]|uniref:Uncharacterized protein n=1 Tax=Vitis vinifera TaxID=29760 RepID=A0A438DDN7_VITVI|nr:hypothetical protein CK203_095932 [Vitis vinifera]
MAALLYFEEKVHRKKLLRADCIPLLFPRLLCQILEHLGYPVEPQHERSTNLEQPEDPVDIPADTQPPAPVVAPTEHILEVPPSAPQATPQPPPVIPPTSEPSPSVEPRIAIPIIEYRGLCHTFQELATSQSILTQQMTALPLEHAIPSPPEPSQAPPFVDQPMPPEEPTTGEVEAAEPSSPQHPPPTI